MTDLQEEIRTILAGSSRVLIVTHIRPDGDAVGSMLALGLALGNSGKTVQMVDDDGAPAAFRHLPGADLIRSKAEGSFDLVIAVDCSDLERTGRSLDGRRPDLIIDHHVTSEPFGAVCLVDPQAAATASILTRCIPGWGLVITPAIAANLLTGLVTDTLGFRNTNTTPEVLRQAADLMEAGAEMSSLYFKALVRRTLAGARYWGAGLTSLQSADGILWASLTLADRRASGYDDKDDADLINVLSSIEEADIAVLFVEQDDHHTKVSWRSLTAAMDVSRIAQQFGGGGHRAASGAELEGSLAEIQQRVLAGTLEARQQYLETHSRGDESIHLEV
jgi:phosphoesterase RecJ-like protein